jgi:hypothetical protein
VAVGIRHADHVAPSIRKKKPLTSLTSGGRSIGIVCLRTEAMKFLFIYLFLFKVFFHFNGQHVNSAFVKHRANSGAQLLDSVKRTRKTLSGLAICIDIFDESGNYIATSNEYTSSCPIRSHIYYLRRGPTEGLSPRHCNTPTP